MRKLTEEEQAIDKRVTELANKLLGVLNADMEAGGDYTYHLSALAFCITGVAIRLGVDHKTFLNNLDMSYQVMQEGASVDLVELQPGESNAHH